MEKYPNSQELKKKFELQLSDIGFNKKERDKKKALPEDKTWVYLSRYGEIGFSIATLIFGGTLLGKYLDNMYAIYPRATLILLFSGVVVSFIIFYKMIRDI